MGTSGWDEDAWARGRGSRDGRAGEGVRPDRRAYERPAYGSASSRESERPDRNGRGLPRDRSDANPRTSSGGWERPRGSWRDDSQGSDRRRRPPAGGYDDTYDGRGGSSSRVPRPPARGGPTPRGGLWDDTDTPRRRRPDGSDPRGRPGGRIDPRDPRAFRRGLMNSAVQPLPPKKSSFGLGTAILIILLMFLIGAGAAYGYFRLSTPTVHGPTPSAPGATPASSTPGAGVTPSASPHSNVPAADPVYVVL